jgi:LuxR family transcriptional regulator, transcriptional regulator of spore coat protein
MRRHRIFILKTAAPVFLFARKDASWAVRRLKWGMGMMGYGLSEFDKNEDVPVLTGRECEVLRFVAIGQSNKEMAKLLGIAPRTVERHIENLRNKIRARNRAHMIAKAIAYGVLISNGDEMSRMA